MLNFFFRISRDISVHFSQEFPWISFKLVPLPPGKARKELQSENLQRRIKNRSTKLKTSTFGKRRLSRATSDETSYRYRRPSVADVTNDTIIDINNNSSSSNKYVEDGVESGGDHDGSDSGDSSDGSDMEINAWIAKSRKNSLLKNARITPINIHNIDNSSLKSRRTTQLFDMEVEAEVAVLNLKIEQSRRRENMTKNSQSSKHQKKKHGTSQHKHQGTKIRK